MSALRALRFTSAIYCAVDGRAGSGGICAAGRRGSIPSRIASWYSVAAMAIADAFIG
jgi:hypothetical protein